MPNRPSDPLGISAVNIYYLHHNPTIAAEMLLDAHVRAAAAPLAQLLANAYFLEGAARPPPERQPGQPYAPDLLSHPCAIWTTEDFKQWNWVLMYAWGAAREAERRFGVVSPALPALKYMNQNFPVAWMANKHFWDPPLVIPAEFKTRISGAMASYRLYYREGLKASHRWTGRVPPLWIVEQRRAGEEASRLVDASELALVEPDRHRTGLFPGLDDRAWGEVKRRATEMVNGTLEDEDDRAEQLVDAADIGLVEPDKWRPAGLSDAEWEVIKHIAEEAVNGRDPLAEPRDWDYTSFRG